MSARNLPIDDQVAFVRTANRGPENTDRVRKLVAATGPDILADFYRELAKVGELSGHIGDAGRVERLTKAQLGHWDEVFAGELSSEWAAKSLAIGRIHAQIGLSTGWYISAYAWLILRMIDPIVSANRFRPGGLKRDLTALITRAFADMIASTGAYEARLVSGNAADVEHEGDLRNLRNLAGTVSDVNEVALELAYLSRNTRNVTSNAQTIASAVAELAASVDEIARTSEGAAGDAVETDRTAAVGRNAVDQVRDAIGNIAGAVDETAHSVDELAKASGQIGQILGVIEGIAAQTNLLALNATIEAARAGDAGRGFGVVAAEVKSLANQTAKATEDIASRIATLRGGMDVILETMSRSKTAVLEGQTAIGEAARTMEGIASQVGNVSLKMRDISSILAQQKGASSEIGRSVEHVAGTASENEDLLFRISGKLHESNDRFTANAQTWFKAESHRALCEMAKIDHVLFKKRVVDVLMGRAQWTAAAVPDHNGCRLGQWYASVRIPEITSLPAFGRLVEPHKRVHAAARAALEAHAINDSTAALASLAAMGEASQEVLACLDELSAALFDRFADLDRRKDERPAGGARSIQAAAASPTSGAGLGTHGDGCCEAPGLRHDGRKPAARSA